MIHDVDEDDDESPESLGESPVLLSVPSPKTLLGRTFLELEGPLGERCRLVDLRAGVTGSKGVSDGLAGDAGGAEAACDPVVMPGAWS